MDEVKRVGEVSHEVAPIMGAGVARHEGLGISIRLVKAFTIEPDTAPPMSLCECGFHTTDREEFKRHVYTKHVYTEEQG